MDDFRATTKKWGNSLGVTIPREIVKKHRLGANESVELWIVSNDMEPLRKAFGTLKRGKKSTQQMLDEADRELYGI